MPSAFRPRPSGLCPVFDFFWVFFPAFLGIVLGGRLALLSQDVVISEILAANQSVLEDEDGDTSDWIELYNATGATIDLDGWFLTDEAAFLPKWRFPRVSLPGRGFLLVFASGKDRRDPARELHASFELSSAGEFLALVRPDGVTVEHGWDPFPPQVTDFSYGLRQNADRRLLVADRASCRVLIPTSAESGLGVGWTARTFDDSAWIAGETGVGYDRNTEYRPLIRTDVRGAMDGVNTTAWVRVPFEVDDPAGLSRLSLRMKYDDGFAAWVNGTLVASANAPSNPRWDSSSTSQHDDSLAVSFEDFDVAASGVLVSGTNVLAIQSLNDNLGSSDSLALPELRAAGTGELEIDVEEFFSEPSPGGGNPPGFPGIARAPVFSVPATVFTGTLSVALSSPEAGAVVRYTTDGSEPDGGSAVASGAPLSLTESTLLRARAFAGDLAPSPIRTQGYVRLSSSVRAFTSDLPVVVVENFGRGSIPADPFQPAYMAIFEPGEGRTRLDRPPELETRVGIKIRGSSTQGRPKKAYRLEAWNESGGDKDIEPLGLSAESDWILYGAYNFDLALMRNAFIYELSRQIGVYAVRTRFCEVWVNEGGGTVSDSDYVGVYSFMESIKRGPDRVDVESLDASVDSEPDIAGGYMLKIDRLDPGDSGLSAGGQRLGHVYPKEDRITPEQRNWIGDYIDDFVSALGGAGFRDPDLGYARYIDVDLWVDHHILNVLPMNVDALRLSTYLYKPRFGKLTMGPIWDFDRSMESTDGRDDNPRTWYGGGDATRFFDYPWWARLFDDPDFWQRWIDRWTELRRGELTAAHMSSILDAMREEIREAAPRNFQKWGLISPSQWPAEVDRVKNYLRVRADWIDSQFARPPVVSPAGQEIEPGFEVTITAPSGEIWYTIDGSDPRLRGGAVAPGAIRYDGSFSVDENARVVARARRGADWSGVAAETYWTRIPRIVISELMFHPPAPLVANERSDEDYEFIELFNADDRPLELEGFSLEGGVRFTFEPGAVLAPGDYVVLVRNLEAFEERYGVAGIRIEGEYEGRLDNSGEELVLFGPLREPIHSFSYSDVWYPATDGEGRSLVVADPFQALDEWPDSTAWAESTVIFGTPGEDDPGLTGIGGRQRPGDANQDGIVDLSDAIQVLRRLFVAGAPPLPCEGNSPAQGGNRVVFDVNDDAAFDISDGVHLLEWLFKDGPPPALGTTCVRVEGCPGACGR